MDNAARNELSDVLVALLKGVVYNDISAELWRDLLNFQGGVRDHLRLLGLDLIIDEAEGYAYLRQSEAAGEETSDSPRSSHPPPPPELPGQPAAGSTSKAPRRA